MLTVQTEKTEQLIDITRQVQRVLSEQNPDAKAVLVFVPHTTAGVTINENADPDVVTDLLVGLNAAFPDRKDFKHREGNSAAHLKASAMGSSVMIPVERGKLVLGTWQGIYFCEFDGPRSRKVQIQLL